MQQAVVMPALLLDAEALVVPGQRAHTRWLIKRSSSPTKDEKQD